jgi:hypothetical protein
MALIALIAWIATVSAGLYLLAIWLIEYDREFQSSAATRLPVPVIGTHALLALCGLAVWGIYVVTDTVKLAWVAAATLGVVALLGLTMAARWIVVYRTHDAPRAVPMPIGARHGAESTSVPVPPERHFPLPVVIAHGAFATTTILLVLLSALRVGGS